MRTRTIHFLSDERIWYFIVLAAQFFVAFLRKCNGVFSSIIKGTLVTVCSTLPCADHTSMYTFFMPSCGDAGVAR